MKFGDERMKLPMWDTRALPCERGSDLSSNTSDGVIHGKVWESHQ